MNPNQQPQGQTTQPETDVLSARPEDSLPLSAFASPRDDYSLESLDVATPGGSTTTTPSQATNPFVSGTGSSQAANQPRGSAVSRATRFSSRRAALVSLAVTMVVIIIMAASATIFLRNSPTDNTGTNLAIPTQDVDVATKPQLDIELAGDAPSLLVKGDVVARGKLTISTDGFLASLQSTGLTSNQTYTLPDSSGVVCLDSNNCQYVTTDQLTAIQAQVNGATTDIANSQADIATIQTQLSNLQSSVEAIPDSFVSSLNNKNGALTIQGTANRVVVTTTGNTITLSTPQDLGPTSTPTFGGLTISGTMRLSGLNCTTNANNGALTTDASGNIMCSDDDGGGAAGVTSLNSLTNALTVQGTAGQITITDNGSDTITLALNANVSLLGQTIGQSELEADSVNAAKIVDASITEADLNISNAETISYVLASDGSGGFTWVPQTTDTNTQLTEAQVEAYIFDADNTGTLSSGTLALGSLSYTGTLSDLYVADNLTVSAAGSVADGALSANVSLLGQTIESSEITNGTITAPDLSSTNVAGAGTDSYVLTYDNATGGFTYVSQAAVAGSAGVNSLNSLQGALTIAGTANQVTVTDNGTDTITLSLPQDIAATSAPTFATLNTGQGAHELYAMNQNVQTTDDVTFNSLTLTSALTLVMAVPVQRPSPATASCMAMGQVLSKPRQLVPPANCCWLMPPAYQPSPA